MLTRHGDTTIFLDREKIQNRLPDRQGYIIHRLENVSPKGFSDVSELDVLLWKRVLHRREVMIFRTLPLRQNLVNILGSHCSCH
jgi:hypothetical protein